MRVLVTGAAGQVGRALNRWRPADAQIFALRRAELDLCDQQAVRAVLAELRPDVVINAAAYTAVDKAETDPHGARQVNVDSVRWLAEAVADQSGCRLLHVSTDFVFDGASSLPYGSGAPTAPMSVYGQTKLAGEQVVTRILGARGLVLRTSWIYDATGKNFLNTMLRLMSEGKSVRVVADQVGTPTAASSVATTLWMFVAREDLSGIWHWSDAGVASWYDFAVAISEEGRALGLLKGDSQVIPIATSEYPTPAKRPAFSVLDKRATVEALQVTPVHWRQNLRQVMKEIMSA